MPIKLDNQHIDIDIALLRVDQALYDLEQIKNTLELERLTSKVEPYLQKKLPGVLLQSCDLATEAVRVCLALFDANGLNRELDR